jgi:hypothetical protein
MLTSASNKRISNRAPSDYLKEVEKAAGENLQAWLDTNLISEAAFEAAKEDDFSGFLAHRAQTLHRLLLPLAGWSPDDADQPAVDEVPAPSDLGSDDSDLTDELPTGEAIAPDSA